MSIDPPLIVVARLKAKPGKRTILQSALLALAGYTRAEPGSLAYDLHVSEDDPDSFIIYERWKNDAALDAHFKTPHMQRFRAKAQALLSNASKLEKLREVS